MRRCGVLRSALGCYQAEATEDRLLAYSAALEHLSARYFDLAIKETLRAHRSSFPPSPGEMLDYLGLALLRLPPATSNADPECSLCRGTGWAMIERDGHQFAVSCECLKKKSGAR